MQLRLQGVKVMNRACIHKLCVVVIESIAVRKDSSLDGLESNRAFPNLGRAFHHQTNVIFICRTCSLGYA